MATEFLAPEIFSIKTRRHTPLPRQYRVTWPCGSDWVFDRHDLEIPEFENGEQNGSTFCFDTIREARETLAGLGCQVELVKQTEGAA